MIKIPEYALYCSLCEKTFGYSDKEAELSTLLCKDCVTAELEFEKIVSEVRQNG